MEYMQYRETVWKCCFTIITCYKPKLCKSVFALEEGTAIPMTFDKCFFDAKKREEEEKLAAAKKREEEEKEAAVQNAKEQKERKARKKAEQARVAAAARIPRRAKRKASLSYAMEDQFERDKNLRKELNAYKKRKNK